MLKSIVQMAGREAREQGTAMVTTLFGVVIVSGLVYSSTMVATIELTDARGGVNTIRAERLAQAGVERGMHHLRDVMRRYNVVDPMVGIRNLFAGKADYRPWADTAYVDGDGRKVGDYSVTMQAVERAGGFDVTITATGYTPASPSKLPANARRPTTRAMRVVVRLETRPSSAFDSSYFINNWGWFYGNSITASGNVQSNGQFDAGGYRPMITGQPTYERLIQSGGNVSLDGYKDDNNDGKQDGQDGGIFAGWDVVGAHNVQGFGGQERNQHDFQEPVPMPNLTDLSRYEAQAIAEGGSIKVGGVPVATGVYGDDAGEKQNLYLIGTAADPIQLDGPIVVRGNVIISGHVTGQGVIYAGGNVYVPNEITYVDGPLNARPGQNTQVATENWLSKNYDKDLLGLFARENVVVGDFTDPTWRTHVSSWLSHSLNQSKEDAGEDGIPNTRKGKDGILGTADDDVLEGDGIFTVERYTADHASEGTIPAGYSIGDVIPGTGEDIDGDGKFDDTITLADLEITGSIDATTWGNAPATPVTYSTIASTKMKNLDAITYTNHAFAWLTTPGTPINVNGAIVSRNESIIYSGTLNINYDCRLLAGAAVLNNPNLLPRVPAPVQVVSWQMLDHDPHRGELAVAKAVK